MNIYKELDIALDKRELICFVGAGGKSTTMFLLADELKAIGKRVLITTTTSILYPIKDQYDEIIINDNPKYHIVRAVIKDSSITVIAKEENPMGKLKGLKGEMISDIFQMGIFDYVLVECDGAKRKPIKAPAYYEPVIPRLSTKVIGVIGLDCLYKNINNKNVHRPEIFCNIINCKMDEIITEEMVKRLIIDENGLFKNNGLDLKKYLILNKADNTDRRKSGFLIEDLIKRSNFKIDKIIIASMNDKKCYYNIETNITGIILASGFSRRIGKQKLLLEIEKIPIIERVIQAVQGSQIANIILIYRDEKVKCIADKYRIRAFYNHYAEKGQSEAIKLGVRNSCSQTKGYMFFVGDQPYLHSQAIDEIINTFQNDNKKIVIPKYNNKNGNPVLFSSELKDKLLKLNGDIGGRSIIKDMTDKELAYVYFSDEKLGIDVDTIEEYEALRK